MLKNEIKAAAGKKGGLARSQTKRASSAANLRKARVKRWPGREVAAQQVAEAQLNDAEDRGLLAQLNSELGLVTADGKPTRRALFRVEFVPGDEDA